MASCVCFCQCSRRACLALLVPISAALSCSHGSFLIIPLTFIFLSTIFLLTFSKTKPIQENEALEEENDSSTATGAVEGAEGGSEEATLMGISQQDMMLYSESESMDHFSSSEGEQRLDFSDGSISDEESDLIEIAIPSGQFLWNVKCCKHLPQDLYKAEMNHEMNEEEDDNLFEIDINI